MEPLTVLRFRLRTLSETRRPPLTVSASATVAPSSIRTEPFTLPTGVEPAPRRVLIEHEDFEIPRPTAVSVLGFSLLELPDLAALAGEPFELLGLRGGYGDEQAPARDVEPRQALAAEEVDGVLVGGASLDPASFRLYNMGVEVAIHFQGDTDPNFEDGEYLLFLNELLGKRDSFFRISAGIFDDQIYFLTKDTAIGIDLFNHHFQSPGLRTTQK